MLLCKTLQTVQGPYEFVFGLLIRERVILSARLPGRFVQFVNHVSFISKEK